MGGPGSGRQVVYSDDDCRAGCDAYNRGATWQEAERMTGVPWPVLRDRAAKRGWRIRERRRRPRNQRIVLPTDRADLAYLAAMIDGEGHLSRRMDPRGNRSVGWCVGISNQSEALMDWLGQMGGCVTWPTKSDVGRWQVTARRDVVALLRATRPYMKIKQDRALTALDELLALERMA